MTSSSSLLAQLGDGHANATAANPAHPALDAVSGSVNSMRANAGPAMQELAGSAESLLRARAHAASERALQWRDSGADYIRERPLQAVMLATGAGALLVLLASLVARSGGSSR